MTIKTLPEVRPDRSNGTTRSTSASHPEIEHTVTVAVGARGELITRCTCPAGQFARADRKPVACRHGHAVAHLLESVGAVEATVPGRYALISGLRGAA